MADLNQTEPGPVHVELEITRQEYIGLEDVYNKYGLSVELPGWKPAPYLQVIKRLVEQVRGKK